jgi:mannose-6-phosphate isomerase-like protein (cupin superfamily)
VLDLEELTAGVYGGDVTRALLFTTQMRPGQHVVRVALATTRPGLGGQEHHHPHTDEHYLILDGTADVVIDGAAHRLTAPALVRVPRGSVHRMSNGGDAPLRYLAFHVADDTFSGAVEHVTAP